MKKILVLALIALMAWQVTLHLPSLFARRPEHEAVVKNGTGRELSRLRLRVAGRTFAADSLARGGEARFRFGVRDDAVFELTWALAGTGLDNRWRGGLAPRGPIVQRHVIAIDADGGVIYTATPIAGR